MTLLEMKELIQQHHPDMKLTEIVKELNRAMDDFSCKSKVVKDTYTFDVIQNQRYYKLDDNIIEVSEVNYDAGDSKGKRIPMLTFRPQERDVK
tara:strand:+ start:1529 stop:1807 length:279 start_codon:yes stop_codon:yes gene_type:complete